MTEIMLGPGGDSADVPAAGEHPFRPVPRSGPGTWSLSWHGVRTVAVLELRQRVKSTRWIIMLVLWAVVIGLLTGLIRNAFGYGYGVAVGSSEGAGATMFAVIVFLVLSLGALVSPALSATSVNGDRLAGVLAPMQCTLLTPAELAIGKLLAAWACALALLGAALPFVVWAYFAGGTSLGRLLSTLVLLSLTLLVVCAIGLGYSALATRTSSSVVLTYLTVTLLGLGLPVLYGLTLPLVSVTERAPVRIPVADVLKTDAATGTTGTTITTITCTTQTQVTRRVHTERTWWLLAASPYVVVADAAPRPTSDLNDPLTAIRTAVRALRLGPAVDDRCSDEISLEGRQRLSLQRQALPPVWPYGLAADLALGAGFLVLTVRALRTPTAQLPRGTRIA